MEHPLSVLHAPRTMKVTGQTRVQFILADPVAQVVATHVLNQRFAEDGFDVVSVPLHVRAEDLTLVVAGIRRMPNVIGLGVTIPHKITVIPLLDALTDRARRIGSVNAVRRNADGSLLGDNLDGQGFVDGMAACGVVPQGRRVHQFGAGGAGRAVAFSVAAAGARELVIHNRTAGRAEALVHEVAAAGGTCTVRAGNGDPTDAEVIINTTSQGLRAEDAPLFDYARLRSEQTVADIIMAPEITPLLAAAMARGCQVGLGKHMLAAQYGLVRELLALR